MVALIIVSIVVVLIIVYVISTYNALVNLRNNVKDAWARVDVVLKRRADLVPNLVETVKGYAKHEQTTLDEVISARNGIANATTPKEEMQANNMLTEALGKLMAVAEAYPDLKANTNFLSLQEELSNTENQIANSRQVYNDTVLMYKNKLEMFPSNIVAGMFKFETEEFFEIAESEKEVPQVKF